MCPCSGPRPLNFPLRCCSLARSPPHTSKTTIREYCVNCGRGCDSTLKRTKMLLVLGVFVFAVALLVHRLLSKRRARSLPPGPTPSFIIGNALQIPRTEPWVWCGTSMKEQYGQTTTSHVPLLFSQRCQIGEISYLSVFGQPMIILNSLEAINEIFLKRSAIHSDRPKSIIAGEMYAPARRLSSSVLILL